MTYAYLRDGSVLGRVTGWRGGVPIIDTTDRHPGPDIADLAGPPPGSPSEDVAVRTKTPSIPSLDPSAAPPGSGRRPDRP